MSTSAPRSLFFVYAPDYTEEGTLEKRMAVRPAHLESAKAFINSGVIRTAGAVLDKDSSPSDASKKFLGSTFVLEIGSLEEARKMIENDIYYTSGVWDKEKLVIAPFLAATPIP